MRQSALTKSIDEQAASLFIFEISSKNSKFRTPPDTAKEVKSAINQMNAEICSLSAEIDAIKSNENQYSNSQTEISIPAILWDKFYEARQICPNSTLDLICLAIDVLENVNKEHSKMSKISKTIQAQEQSGQDWITFVSQMWVSI